MTGKVDVSAVTSEASEDQTPGPFCVSALMAC